MTAAGGTLLVTRNFPPLLGGMEAVNQRMLSALAARGAVALVSPTGGEWHVPPGVVHAGAGLRPTGRFLASSLIRTISLARQLRPRHVIAGSGLTAPAALTAARTCGAKSLVYLHGLDIIARNRLYRQAWLPCIRACDAALVNSRNTAKLAETHGVHPDRIHLLHPGTDLPAPTHHDPVAFRRKYGLGDGRLLLSVGRLTPRKGIAEFIVRSLPAIVAQHPDTALVVIGGEATDAIGRGPGSQTERIRQLAVEAGVANHLHLLGRCEQRTLESAYAAAKCHVFPVLDLPGDVEGFGMVALEAAARGLHTVAFDVGGVADAIAPGISGTLIREGDYADFAQAVAQALARHDTDASRKSRGFAAGMSWEHFDARLNSILDALP